MIYHVRELSYTKNYQEFFTALSDLKNLVDEAFPEIKMTLMYNLDGERKKVHIVTSYSDMGEFERINDELDKNDKIMETTINLLGTGEEDRPFTDHFYRGI